AQHGVLRFSAANYSVNENGGSVTLTITRTGGSTGTGSVTFGTRNGTATGGQDYAVNFGTLTFAQGETSKTVRGRLLGGTLVEGNETFQVVLSNPTGGATLGSPSTAIVTIIDNDGRPAAPLAANLVTELAALETAKRRGWESA